MFYLQTFCNKILRCFSLLWTCNKDESMYLNFNDINLKVSCDWELYLLF